VFAEHKCEYIDCIISWGCEHYLAENPSDVQVCAWCSNTPIHILSSFCTCTISNLKCYYLFWHPFWDHRLGLATKFWLSRFGH
jgi:hypothetical protein